MCWCVVKVTDVVQFKRMIEENLNEVAITPYWSVCTMGNCGIHFHFMLMTISWAVMSEILRHINGHYVNHRDFFIWLERVAQRSHYCGDKYYDSLSIPANPVPTFVASLFFIHSPNANYNLKLMVSTFNYLFIETVPNQPQLVGCLKRISHTNN